MADDDVDKDAPLPPIVPLDPEVEELWSSRALLLVLILLILSFWVSYYLKVRRIKSIHETLVALIAGGFVGLVVRLSPGTVVQNMISFKNTILLNVLLPPIILNSGFELRQANFFRNFGVILVFAFAGTFISAVVCGVLVYIWALLGLEGLSLSIVECLIFGSTLSATDPVTILAIFNALKVDPKLYSIIFGESILNDAVAIVMFETLSQFHGEKIHILSFFHGVGIFLLIFLTSMALGVVFGLACSLMLKHSRLNEYPEIESCLIILIAYTSYFFSNGLTMSGIVSLLFCGITLKHYAYHNMSRRSQKTSKYIFASLAQICENFIFIYLGLSLFTQTDLVYKPLFIVVTCIAVVAARWAAVFPLAKLINVIWKARGARTEELPQSYQVMLFWAGLRGAVGVALAAGIKGHNAKSLRTTVLVAVVMTLVVFGGSVNKMVGILGIRTGVEEEDDGAESSDDEGPQLGSGNYRAAGAGELPYSDRYNNESTHSLALGNGKRHSVQFRRGGTDEDLDTDEEDNEVLPSASSSHFVEGEGQDGAVWRDGQWFNVLDEQYLLPVFSNAVASRRQASRKAMRSNARAGGNDSLQDEDGDTERDLGSARSPISPWQTSQNEGERSYTGAQHHGHAAAPSLSQAITQLFSGPAQSPTDGTGLPSTAGPSHAIDMRPSALTSATANRMIHSRSSSQPKSLHNPFLSSGRYSPNPNKRRDSSDHGSTGGIPSAELSNYPLAGSQELAAPSSVSPSRRTFGTQIEEGTPSASSSVRNANLSVAREETGGALLRRQSGPAATQSSVNGSFSLKPENGLQARHHSLSTPTSSTTLPSAAPHTRLTNLPGQVKEGRGQD